MNRQKEIYQQVGVLTAIGIGLLAIVLLTPNGARHTEAFYQAALQTTWSDLLDYSAAWSSIKIILLSISLFLLIESAGTVLSMRKYRSLAILVFFFQIIPCAALFCGGYYLLKSLF